MEYSNMYIFAVVLAAVSSIIIIAITLSIYFFYRKKLQIIDPMTKNLAELENLTLLNQDEKELLENWKLEQKEELENSNLNVKNKIIRRVISLQSS